MNPKSTTNTIANEKMFRIIGYAVVFLMVACVVMTFGSLIQNLAPNGHAAMIAGILLFIVIDRLYTYPQVKNLSAMTSEWAIAVGSQWIVIALVIRLLLSYARGLDAFLADLSLFGRGSLEMIFTPEYVFTLFLALVVWVLTAQFLTLLDEIGLDAAVALRDEQAFLPSSSIPPHQRLVNLIFSLGIFLVILTLLARLNLRSTFSNTTGLPAPVWNRFSGVEAGALLYFVFGLALLSLSRLMSLQTHWNRQRIPISSKNLTRRWGMYSLFFLLLLAVFVSLLPAGDSFGFFSVLGTVLGFLILILSFLALLIIGILSLLFSLPFLLLGKAPPMQNAAPAPLPPLQMQPSTPLMNSALWELIRSIFLWGALAALIIFAFIAFVRQHDSVLAAIRRSRITNWLILAWQWLYRGADKTRLSLSRAIADGWQTIRSRLQGKRLQSQPGWIRVRSLDPRRQIYFFYLAMIRRGTEQGLTRKPSQTPSEYARRLEKDLPSSKEDIASITQAFVEARYSRQEIQPEDVNVVKATWGRIRQALQTKSKQS